MILKSWQLVALSALGAAALYLAWPKTPDLAEVELRSGSVDEGIRMLEHARTRAPEDPELRRRLEAAYEQHGRTEGALRLLELEGRAHPLSADERARVRRLALANGQPGRALDALTGPHEPQTARELPGLVALARQADRPALALRLQSQLVAEAPSPEGYALLRDLALAAADPQRAVGAQRQLAMMAPTRANRDRLVALLLGAGDNAGALAELEALGPGEGGEAAFHRRAAQLAEWAGEPQAALPHYQALYALAPDMAVGKKLLFAYTAAKDPRAIALATQLAAAHPGDAELAKARLDLLLAFGRVEEALGLARAAVAQSPDDPAAHDRLVALALGHGQQALAADELGRWLTRHPGDAPSLHQLAVVQVWAGRPAEAWKTYERLLVNAPLRAGPETAWRVEWAALSGPLDDLTDAGRANLRALDALLPDALAVRRRRAAAANEAGDRTEALAVQRRVVADRRATLADELTYARWLYWYAPRPEADAYMLALDDRRHLPFAPLAEAGYGDAEAERWDEAAAFLGRAAAEKPTDVETWRSLARIETRAGRLDAAVSAWRRRLALGGSTPVERLELVSTLFRLGCRGEAFELLTGLGRAASLDERRQLAALAYELKRPAAQRRALAAVLELAPQDIEARLALGELADREGDRQAADAEYAQAVALRPDDPAVVARVAAYYLYDGRIALAGPLVEKLAGLPEPPDDPGFKWRVIADYFQDRDPRRAATALDAFHRTSPGDAETHFRRGELATQLGDAATARAEYQRAADATVNGGEATQAEARAAALERLGREAEAIAAYEAIARAHPQRLQPLVALGRHFLDARRLSEAEPYLARARRLAPAGFETRLLEADWLAASGRHAEAAAAYAALRRDRPALAFLASAEASERHALGQFRAARDAGADALALAPDDAGTQDAYRFLRADGTSRVGARTEHEASSVIERNVVGLAGHWLANDRLKLGADAEARTWGALPVQAQDLGLTADWNGGPFAAHGRLGMVRRDGQVDTPLGELWAHYAQGLVTARLGAAEARWEDSSQAVAANGREHRVEADAALTPDPRVTVHANAQLGMLALHGADANASRALLGEVALRPRAGSPLTLYYQLRDRRWGDAGPTVGLPLEVLVHSLLLGWADRLGPWRFELQPGYSYDALNGFGAPQLAATVGLDVARDLALTASGTLSGGNFLAGQASGYQRLELTAGWHF